MSDINEMQESLNLIVRILVLEECCKNLVDARSYCNDVEIPHVLNDKIKELETILNDKKHISNHMEPMRQYYYDLVTMDKL